MKHVRHRPGVRHVAAVLAEHVAYFADRAVAVVGADFHQHRYAARAVALEREFLVVHAGQLPGAALGSALDVVGWHVLCLGCSDSSPKPRISIRIAASRLRRHGNFLDQTGENLAALGIQRALFVLDCVPLGMAGHDATSSSLDSIFTAGIAARQARGMKTNSLVAAI